MKLFLHHHTAVFIALFVAVPAFAAPWVSRHGMSASDYQAEFNKWTAEPYDYRLISISGYEEGGQARYAAIWERGSGPSWITHHGMTKAQFDSTNAIYARQDSHPVFISGFTLNGQAYYNAIWEYLPNADVVPMVGLTYSAYVAENRSRTSQGYALVFLWTFNVGSSEYFAAIWRKGVTQDYEVRSQLSGAQYQQAFNDLGGQGFQLVSVSTAVISGQERYTGVWKKPGDGVAWYSTHSLSAANYQGESWNWQYQGYRPVFVSAFVRNGAPRFNAIWFNNGGLSPANLQLINTAVQGYIQSNNIPGVSIAIANRGRLLYAKGFGFADQAAGDLVHPHHRFRIASISKPITAAAILRLRDKGLLNLDQTVFGQGALLGTTYGTAAYSNRERTITVRQLLDHTSGWINDGVLWSWNNNIGTEHAAVIGWQLDNANQPNPPGTAFQYMNMGYVTAGRIIERLTGKSYEQFVQDEILGPCCISQMEIGGRTLAERKANEVVYYPDNTFGDPYTVINPARMDANGGWIGRPIDLLLFLRRIDVDSTQTDILHSSSLSEMQNGSMPQPGYGLGLVLTNSGGIGTFANNQWGHNEQMTGTASFLV